MAEDRAEAAEDTAQAARDEAAEHRAQQRLLAASVRRLL